MIDLAPLLSTHITLLHMSGNSGISLQLEPSGCPTATPACLFLLFFASRRAAFRSADHCHDIGAIIIINRDPILLEIFII